MSCSRRPEKTLRRVRPLRASSNATATGHYRTHARKNARVVPAGCWAHARRKFFEAKGEAPAFCGRVSEAIGELYMIERESREARAGPGQRAGARVPQSRAIAEELHRSPINHRGRHPPKGGVGKAIHHGLGQWPTLARHLGDGQDRRQPARERDPAHGHRREEPALHRLVVGRVEECGALPDDRESPPAGEALIPTNIPRTS